jgi:hypothetical protein
MGNLVSELSLQEAFPEYVTADHFAENILGFEEVDEDDEEGGDEGEMGQSQMVSAAG